MVATARRQDVPGVIYIAHFDRPIGNPDVRGGTASHYVGWTERAAVEDRWAEHLAGRGAKVVAAAVGQGIGVTFRVIEENVTRRRERQIKTAGHHDRRCPCCRAAR